MLTASNTFDRGSMQARHQTHGGVRPAVALSALLALLLLAGIPAAACRPPTAGSARGARVAGEVAQPATVDALRETDMGAAGMAEPAGESAPERPEVVAGTAAPGDAAALPPPVQPAAPVRIPRPAVPAGPRRIGLQVGHWRNDELPDELRRIQGQTGTSWGAVAEWQVNLDVANRVAVLLRGRGFAVDVLPAAVPPGYLADAFVALHADGDPNGAARGFKAAHGTRRGPFEDHLVRVLVEEYGRATGLPLDDRVTRNMLGYYAFSWSRFQASVASHTPAAILEMGFLTSAADRGVLLLRADTVAAGVANGIGRFLDEVPPGAAFAEDLVVPPARPFQPRPTTLG
jgi:N-acetylmuramoyl-L-alanine amidase